MIVERLGSFIVTAPRSLSQCNKQAYWLRPLNTFVFNVIPFVTIDGDNVINVLVRSRTPSENQQLSRH
jgi:hypothetical protein